MAKTAGLTALEQSQRIKFFSRLELALERRNLKRAFPRNETVQYFELAFSLAKGKIARMTPAQVADTMHVIYNNPVLLNHFVNLFEQVRSNPELRREAMLDFYSVAADKGIIKKK